MAQTTPLGNPEDFKAEFLRHYLSVGIGGLSKRDTDALVMHLLDKFGKDAAGPLAHFPNQEVSALLRAPASKIRQLRYEAGLKYGGKVEDQAKARLLVALTHAVLDVESKTICLVIEDALAKNWLQGQLKNNGLIFDHSFNTEIVKVKATGLFLVLGQIFDQKQTSNFSEAYKRIEAENQTDQLRAKFGKIALAFASGAAEAAGGAVLASFHLFGG